MLEHVLTHEFDSPCAVIRFHPDGTTLLGCQAFSDEVHLWRVNLPGGRLEHLSRFHAGNPDHRFRDAAWLGEDRVAICGLARPLQIWDHVGSGTPTLCNQGELFTERNRQDSILRLYPRFVSDMLLLNQLESGLVLRSMPDGVLLAQDVCGGGTAWVSEEGSLVGSTYVDQAASLLRFGALCTPDHHGSRDDVVARTVDWFPLDFVFRGDLFGVAVDETLHRAVLFHGDQASRMTVVTLPDVRSVAEYDVAEIADFASTEAKLGQFEAEGFLTWDEGLLCPPLLHHGTLIYPGLAGVLVVVSDIFGQGQTTPVRHHKGAISSWSVSGEYVAFSSHDSTISVWRFLPDLLPASQIPTAPLPPEFHALVSTLGDRLGKLPGHVFRRNLGESSWALCRL